MLASYPRSGNTWLRFLLFQLLEGRPASFAELDADDSVVGKIEAASSVPRSLPEGGRLLKTHECWRPEYKKAVYLLRDIRAVAVSEYRFVRWRGFFDGDLDAFLDAFVAGKVNPFATWKRHYATWQGSPLATSGALLVVRYEELRAEPVEQLARIVEFLGKPVDEGVLENVIEDNSVERLREREDAERASFHRGTDQRFRFVNRGQVRGWSETLSPRQSSRLAALAREVDPWDGYR